MLFWDTCRVPNIFSPRCSGAGGHSELVESEGPGLFLSTVFITCVIVNKVDFLCVCAELRIG